MVHGKHRNPYIAATHSKYWGSYPKEKKLVSIDELLKKAKDRAANPPPKKDLPKAEKLIFDGPETYKLVTVKAVIKANYETPLVIVRDATVTDEAKEFKLAPSAVTTIFKRKMADKLTPGAKLFLTYLGEQITKDGNRKFKKWEPEFVSDSDFAALTAQMKGL